MSMFFAALADQMEREAIDEGIKALVKQYYRDYTDATEIDAKWQADIENVVGHYCLDNIEAIIADAEEDFNDETGRKVHTHSYLCEH